VKALSRTYISAAAGEIIKNDFETTDGSFKGEFIVDSSISEPTVVYKSDEYWYPNGFNVEVTDANGVALSSDEVSVEEIKHNYLGISITGDRLNG